MARVERDTRQKLIEAAFRLFYRKGFSRVGVDEIADIAGVTKRTLYYHFQSKDAVLAEMLEVQHVLALERARRWASANAATAADVVRMTFSELGNWSSKPDFVGAGFSRLVLELADLPGHPARKIARRHKQAIEAWFAELLGRHGVAEPADRARELVLLMEGAMVLSLVHGGRAYAGAAERAALALIEDRR